MFSSLQFQLVHVLFGTIYANSNYDLLSWLSLTIFHFQWVLYMMELQIRDFSLISFKVSEMANRGILNIPSLYPKSRGKVIRCFFDQKPVEVYQKLFSHLDNLALVRGFHIMTKSKSAVLCGSNL